MRGQIVSDQNSGDPAAPTRPMVTRLVNVYPRFERFWHWTQMALIFFLLFTGFAISGVHHLMPFKPAVMLHTLAAAAARDLDLRHLLAVHHRHLAAVPAQARRHGRGRAVLCLGRVQGRRAPLPQDDVAQAQPAAGGDLFCREVGDLPGDLGLGAALSHLQLLGRDPNSGFWITVVANLHLLAAFAVLSFVIVHVYLLTIGHGFRHHVQPMVTGFDEVELTPEQEAYLEQNEPWRLKA
ncbi:MAG: cytochrome b/b6 domain-containing protein [Paracoccaceae bacterium]